MKHAIFLRGAIRTWNYIKKDTIKFFNEYYDHPDWYVCFWNSNTSHRQQITLDFSGSNLKFLDLKDTRKYYDYKGICDISPSYWRLAYLDHHLSIAKRSYEISKNISYKTVTFIRPDVRYESAMKSNEYLVRLNKLKEMETVCQSIDNDDNFGTNICSMVENYFVNDTAIIAGEIANNIYGTRFMDPVYTDGIMDRFMLWDPHQLMAFIQSRNQIFDRNHFVDIQGLILRPNYFLKEYISSDWNAIDISKKKLICNKLKIDLFDYGIEKVPRFSSNL